MLSFTHRIDIEPSPSHPLSFDELCQRMRKVLFDMNKKHLSRRWEKREPADKFWIMGFKEGDVKGNQHQLHYHLLLHSPCNHNPNIWDDLQFGWIKSPSNNPVNGKRRKMISHRKDVFHLGNEDLMNIYNSKSNRLGVGLDQSNTHQKRCTNIISTITL